MFKIAARLFLAVLVLGLPSTAIRAAGGSSSSSIPTLDASPEATAEMSYKRGLSFRDKAWKFEQKAAETDVAGREKLLKKAQKEFEKAIKAQRSAIKADPQMYQAHSSLGYALRKTGQYDEAIAAYDQALALSPTYTEAIEYRAEAYLGLNQLDEAKNAYLILMRTDQARAEELMTAMRKWLGQQASGSDVSAAELEAFALWVEERANIAGHAAMLVPAKTEVW